MLMRLLLFVGFLCGSLCLDLNEGTMKKYAFMKIMSSCLGEDFVMMIKQQMMKACAECHKADMNTTQEHNFDYLMNHFRSSHDSTPMIPPGQNSPLIMYQPFVYPIFMQSPYSGHSLPQFPAHQNPQQYNTFPHHAPHFPAHNQHSQQYNTFPQHHAPHFPAQNQHPHQYNTFSHQHAAETNAFPPHNQQQFDTLPHHHAAQSNAFSPHNVHRQVPNVHQHNVPNIPFEQYSSTLPQYGLNNFQNLHNLNNKFIDLKHDELNIRGDLSTINNDTQSPLLSNILLRSPIPNNQLGYPQIDHHEKQFYELNPQPVNLEETRKKRALPLDSEDLETMKISLSAKIENMTCVFREMGWLTEENDVNFTFIEEQLKNLNLNMKLQDDLIYSHDNCKDFSMCMPTEKAKHPLMKEIGGALSYMKCMSKKAVTACMKNDFRMYQAKMGYGSPDNSLPMEIDDLLKTQSSDPSQLADDIGSLMFTATADMIF